MQLALHPNCFGYELGWLYVLLLHPMIIFRVRIRLWKLLCLFLCGLFTTFLIRNRLKLEQKDAAANEQFYNIVKLQTKLTTNPQPIYINRTNGFIPDHIVDINRGYSNVAIPMLSIETMDILDATERNFSQQIKNRLPHGPQYRDGIQRVAVVIPYRNREKHLSLVIPHLHRIFSEQTEQQYGIFVIEPIARQTFNRAKLMNIGFMEAQRVFADWDCFIFHDVDLFAQNWQQPYRCLDDGQPRAMALRIRHEAAASDVYKIMWDGYFGGVCAVPKEAVWKANGFSNDFWGWGFEDTEFANRLRLNGYKITSRRDGRMLMLSHAQKSERGNPPNLCGPTLRDATAERYRTDGLNTLNYVTVNVTTRKAYVHVYVDVLEAESRMKLLKEGICRRNQSRPIG